MANLPSGGSVQVMAKLPTSIQRNFPPEPLWRFYPQHTWSPKLFHLPPSSNRGRVPLGVRHHKGLPYNR